MALKAESEKNPEKRFEEIQENISKLLNLIIPLGFETLSSSRIHSILLKNYISTIDYDEKDMWSNILKLKHSNQIIISIGANLNDLKGSIHITPEGLKHALYEATRELFLNYTYSAAIQRTALNLFNREFGREVSPKLDEFEKIVAYFGGFENEINNQT